MRKKATTLRDPLSWAGSDPGVQGMPADSQASRYSGMGIAHLNADPKDIYRLKEMRHKLDDEGYVDGAVNRIASFLTSTLDKKDADEQQQQG